MTADPAAASAPRAATASTRRWLIGGAAVVVAAAIVAVALGVLGSRPVPAALTYIPRASDVVVELRPDIPGDQLNRLGNLLAHFPGFADQSTLAQKLDESLARITSTISRGQVDWATQVKPWLVGPLFAAVEVGPAEGPGASPGGQPGGAPIGAAGPAVMVVFTTDGSVTCEPFSGVGQVVGSHRGLDVRVGRVGHGPEVACVIDGRHVVVGTRRLVEEALDAHADGSGIDRLPAYREARDRLGGDRLATLFANPRVVASDLLAGSPHPAQTPAPDVAGQLQRLPEWVMAGLRAEDNALVADIVTAPFGAPAPGLSLPSEVAFLSAPPPHASTLAAVLPADTAVLSEVHGTGVAIQNLLTALRRAPRFEGTLRQLDAALAALGGPGSLLGWITDAGLVVLPDAGGITGGLVLVAPDAATASAKVDQVRGFLTLVGLSNQGAVTVTETTIAGTRVTLADIANLSVLGPGLRFPGGGSTLPGGATLPDGHLLMSLAARGPYVLVGAGEGFARRVLETASGSSLADTSAYRTAIGLADARTSGQLYVAAEPLRTILEPLLPAAQQAAYESDIKPYLSHLDALLETATLDGSGLHVRIVLTVK